MSERPFHLLRSSGEVEDTDTGQKEEARLWRRVEEGLQENRKKTDRTQRHPEEVAARKESGKKERK